MIRNTLYFFKEALRGLYQAKLMTFVAILSIGFALFLAGGLGIVYININGWVKEASNRVEAVAFINDSAATDSASVASLLKTIRQCPHVAQARYVSKKEAWEHFKVIYGADMLNAVDDNPFPASVEISLPQRSQSVNSALDLQKELQRIPHIDDTRISHQWVALLQRVKSYFLVATIVIAVLLAMALHFMIANTIKLTIYARRELLRNMHFVGATDSYIRMPFILEGMMQGFIGSLLAVSALWAVKISTVSHISLYWGQWYLFFILFFIGVFFGCIGSLSAVRKFMV